MNKFASVNSFTPIGTATLPRQSVPLAVETREPVAFGSLFNSAPWFEVLDRTYGMKIEAVSLDNTEINSSEIQFCDVSDMRGRRIISLPFSDYCDPCVNRPEDWNNLASELMERGAPLKFKLVKNRLPAADTRFHASVSELWHSTDLNASEQEMWDRLNGQARTTVRFARKNGVSVRIGTELKDVMAFYEMHAHVRKAKYRLLAQPVRFFENIHRIFGKRGELFVLLAERGGEAVAGTLFIKQGDVLYYKFNASKATELRPNDLIVWHGMTLGNQLGLKSLDFGVSALSQPGLIHFKRKFATDEREVVQLSWSPPSYANTQGEEIGALLGKLTNALTEEGVSANVGQFASDALYRFFC